MRPSNATAIPIATVAMVPALIIERDASGGWHTVAIASNRMI
jgi:hypothetical protein